MKTISSKEYKQIISKNSKTSTIIKDNNLTIKKTTSKKLTKSKIENNYFDVIINDNDYIKIIYYGHTESMNKFISNSHETYIFYKRQIHNLAKKINNHFLKFKQLDKARINIIPFRKSNRILDKDNLISGIKPIIDSLHKDLNLFKDDNELHSDIHYYQQQIDNINPRIEIEIYNPLHCLNNNLFIFFDYNKKTFIESIPLIIQNENKKYSYFFDNKEYCVNDEEFLKVKNKLTLLVFDNIYIYINFINIKIIEINNNNIIICDRFDNLINLNINFEQFISKINNFNFIQFNNKFINLIYFQNFYSIF